MNLETIYKTSNKWISLTPLIWVPLTILLGLFLIKPLEAIAIPLVALLMYFIASCGVYFLLNGQKKNPLILKNKKILSSISMLLWGFGLIAALIFFIIGLYLYFSPTHPIAGTEQITNNEFGFFVLQSFFFPLGVTLGASKSFVKNA